MHKRLIIVSAIILAGLCGLSALGYYSIGLHEGGLEARRESEFVAVAEQIRLDVKEKLDEFIGEEEKRPYTDYQYSYVPFATNSASAIVRSPLAENIGNGLAYGYFQLESDGTVVSPYNKLNEMPKAEPARLHLRNVTDNLVTALAGSGPTIRLETIPEIAANQLANFKQNTLELNQRAESKAVGKKTEAAGRGAVSKPSSKAKGASGANRRGDYQIRSFDEQQKQRPQVITQSRANVEMNIHNNSGYGYDGSVQQAYGMGGYGGMESEYGATGQRAVSVSRRQQADLPGAAAVSQEQDNRSVQTVVSQSGDASAPERAGGRETVDADQYVGGARYSQAVPSERVQAEMSSHVQLRQGEAQPNGAEQVADRFAQQVKGPADGMVAGRDLYAGVQYVQQPQVVQEETVQIRIEPFTPIIVAGAVEGSMFAGQVFLLRHVQIEQRHFLQGFQLNESELVRQVAESANLHVFKRDMGFDVGSEESAYATHTATLDFGFGELVLNLFELKPGSIARQVATLKRGFFAIVGVVFVAVMLAQASLWRTAREQIRLAKKKDDFISAVSHELRTPLTTIRMHTEMLEKGWIRSEDKRNEYYSTMRQESERLSRLIENVLDFSRIQRGRKKYNFKLGDIDQCISDVVDMMAPCALRAGFVVEKDFGEVGQFAFDPDAVMQIVINLLDNAIKYAKTAEEKIIHVRTKCDNGYVLIEVEDHGPGVPRLQRQKVFDEFYRCADESKRETTGTGLGLALVKRFAQAHDGFVEVLTARPTGAIFRVALVAQE